VTLRCLASIPASIGAGSEDPASIEIIVVDDGSRDGTADAVQARVPDALIVRHQQSAGFTVAANAGLRRASRPLILLLNSDTEIHAGAFEALVAAFDRDSRLGIAGAQLLYPDGSAQWSGGRAPGVAWLLAESSGVGRALGRIPGYRAARPLLPGRDRDVEWVTGAALAMRRAVWDDVGPLDETFRLYGQDLDFCLRARDRGWRVQIIAGCRVLHHHGATVEHVFGWRGRRSRPQTQSLWEDLLRWAEKRRGPAFARRAGRAIAIGGRLRLLGRWCLTPTVPSALREAWRGETQELRVALAALRGSGPGGRT
jgi:GT2 family glycosyltransferase